MVKVIVTHDSSSLPTPVNITDLVVSTTSSPGVVAVDLSHLQRSSDPAFLAAAVAMLVVGRTPIEELWVPHLPNEAVEKLFVKVVNYFANKSEQPHNIDVKFYGDYKKPFNEPPVFDVSQPIVLMGGGTDSCGMYAYYAKKGFKPIGLFYEYGQAAKSYERKAVFDIAEHFKSSTIRVPITLSKIRRELNKHADISVEGAFPARNWLFYLLTLARLPSLNASEIAVSVFKGEFDDKHPDHSPITLQDFQDMVDAYIGAGKCKVVVPMRELDKSDAVYWYKEKIEPEWSLDKTRSCYGMFGRIDGACTGCANKFVAMAAAGYEMAETQFYKSDWKTSVGVKHGSRINPTAATKYFHKYFKRALSASNYEDERNSEIMYVMNKYPPSHKYVQAELQELLASNSTRIQDLLAMMAKRLLTRNADTIEKSMDEARTKPLL